MPRPNTIGEPTAIYNTLLKKTQLEKLQYIAHQERKKGKTHVSAASIIRDAIDKWLQENV